MADLADKLFAISESVRYVAVYRAGGEPLLRQRPGIVGASSSDSDRFEELLVNPTLLTLARQRGDIDCGGLEYLLIRYGNFYQFVQPFDGGHVSVALEPSCQLQAVVDRVRAAIAD